MPGSGYIVDLTGWLYDEAIGGDFTYRTQLFKTNWYKKFGQNYVIGARLELSQTRGDTPFYAVPYVSLRGIPAFLHSGIPALRYQGDTTSTFELEARRRISDRWSVSIFGGSGSVDIRSDTPKIEDNIRAAGIGLRYLVIPKHDAWVGLDIARGPEDTVWYIQMGNAW